MTVQNSQCASIQPAQVPVDRSRQANEQQRIVDVARNVHPSTTQATRNGHVVPGGRDNAHRNVQRGRIPVTTVTHVPVNCPSITRDGRQVPGDRR
jgi:hypothetical protein